MRLGFVVLCVGVSIAVLACGGSVFSADDEGGAPPEAAGDTLQIDALAHCAELANAAKYYSECTHQTPPATYFDDIATSCRRMASKRTRCAAEFEALTLCQADELERCGGEVDACDPEEQAYLDCVSGGSCHSLGGGTISEQEPYETFTTHDACECVDDVRRPGFPPGSPPGGSCETADDCAYVCCPCGPTGQYTAAICDKTITGGLAPGRCASAFAACRDTAWRCDEMLASKSRL